MCPPQNAQQQKPQPPQKTNNIPTDDIPQLLKILQGKGEETQRLAAARALATHKAQARWTVPYLIRILEETPQPLAQEVYNTLVAIGPPEGPHVDQLKHCLQSSHPLLQSYALQLYALGTPPLPEDIVPRVVELLSLSQGPQRLELLQSLGHTGSAVVPKALGAVLDCIADPQPQVGMFAKRLLREIWQVHKGASRDIKPIAAARLKHAHADVRLEAANILRAFVQDPDAADIWEPLLSDTDIRVRQLAIQVCIDDASNEAFIKKMAPSFLPLIQDRDKDIRLPAAILLRITKSSDALVQQKVLQQFQAETDANVKAELSHTLAQLTPSQKTYLHLFRQLLTYPHTPTRLETTRRLHELGVDAAEALPDLIACLRNNKEDIQVRQGALRALQSLGPRIAAPSIPTIERLFDEARATPQPSTEPTTSEKSPTQSLAPPTIEDLLITAAQTLASLGTRGEEVLEAQCHSSGKLSNRVQAAVFKELIGMNDPKPEILVELVRFVEKYPDLRTAAAETVAKYTNDKVVDELLTATLRWKPASRAGGKQNVEYPLDYRLWSIATLGKTNLEMLSRNQRERIIKRLIYLAKEDSTPQVNTEAQTALRRLGVTGS
jgi:HEAT repeat protein